MIGFRDRQPLTGTNRLGLGKEVPNAAGNHILGGSEGRDVFLQKLTVGLVLFLFKVFLVVVDHIEQDVALLGKLHDFFARGWLYEYRSNRHRRSSQHH